MNLRIPMNKQDIDYLKEYYKYDEYSPSKLTRIKKTYKNAKLGQVGSQDNKGYWQIRFKGKVVRIHRLIWLFFNAQIENNMVIDHINRLKSDNTIDNLRLVTPSENVINRDLLSNNKSGYNGISWDKVNLRWRVVIRR